MRLSKFLAMGTATASLILIVAAPSHAQKSKTIQNQRQQTTVKPVAVKPYVRPVAPTVRDHRNAANPAVKPSGEKRKPSGCITPTVGGGCLGIPKNPFGDPKKEAERKRTGDHRVMDHRLKGSDGGPVPVGRIYTSSRPTPPPARKRSPD